MKCIAITLCSNANLDVWSTLQQWPYQSQSQATTQQIWVSRVCVARVRSQLESPLLWCQIKRLIDEHWGVLSAIMKHHFTQHLIKQYMDIIYGHHLLFYDATALLHTSGSWLSCWRSIETPSWVFLHCAVLLASPAVKLMKCDGWPHSRLFSVFSNGLFYTAIACHETSHCTPAFILNPSPLWLDVLSIYPLLECV